MGAPPRFCSACHFYNRASGIFMLGPLITKPCFWLYPRCKDSEFPSPTVVTGPYAEMWVPFRSASVLCRKPAREACCIKALFNPADFTGCLWPGTSVFAALKCHLKSLTTVGEANKATQRSRQWSGAGPVWYPLHRHDYNITTCSWGDHHSVSGYPFPRLLRSLQSSQGQDHGSVNGIRCGVKICS